MKKYITPALMAIGYTGAVILLLLGIWGSFWLMNQKDTLAFIVGILFLVGTISLTINIIYIKIKNKFKNT